MSAEVSQAGGRAARRPRILRLAFVGLLVVEGLAAAYQVANAADVLPMGSEPGQGSPGEGLVLALATLGLLISIFLCAFLAGRPTTAREIPVTWLLSPICAVLLVAHYYVYDTYCGGTGCRIADEAPTAEKWIFGLAAGSMVVGLVAKARPRAGLLGTSVVAFLILGTILFVPFGH